MDISLIEEKLLKAKKSQFRVEIEAAMGGVKSVLDKYLITKLYHIDTDDREKVKEILVAAMIQSMFGGGGRLPYFSDGTMDKLPEIFFKHFKETAVNEFLEKVESLKDQVEEIESMLPE